LGSRYGLTIRTATAADAPGIAELLLNVGRRVEVAALAERLEVIQQAPGTALVALEWGPPSGIIVATWYPVLTSEHLVARITSFLVGPDERRRGVGRLLLKAASQAARAARCTTLHLPDWDREPTISAFAAASGFEARGCDFVRGLRKAGSDPSRS
jgi:aminoglycoside 6'-N-acetyltransferase I